VSLTTLRSLLESRIDQAIAITPPDDSSRLELLSGIKNVESFPEQLASFADYLIDYAASLSLALSQSKASGVRSTHNSRHTSKIGENFEDDYHESLALLKAAPGNLSPAIDDLVQKNLWLQRLHNQDRAILLKQNEMIGESHDDPAELDPVIPTQREIRERPRQHKHRHGHENAFSHLKFEVEQLTDEVGHFDCEVRRKLKIVRSNRRQLN
jgi:hypothetical protein